MPHPYGQREQTRADLSGPLLRGGLVDEKRTRPPADGEVNDFALPSAAPVGDGEDGILPYRGKDLIAWLKAVPVTKAIWHPVAALPDGSLRTTIRLPSTDWERAAVSTTDPNG